MPGFWSRADLRPLEGQGGRLGIDAHLRPGWYLIRARCKLPKARAQGSVWLRPASGPAAERALRLPMRDGKPAMRALRIEQPSALEYLPGPEGSSLLDFRLLRVPSLLVRYLVQRRLRLRHPGYAGVSQAALWRRSFDGLWYDYNLLFDEPHTARLRYADWIARFETPTRAPRDVQRQRLASWPSPPRILWLLCCDASSPPDGSALEATRTSLAAQASSHWELLRLGPTSTGPRDGDGIDSSDPQAWTTAADAALARCDAVGFLEPGDRLRDDALTELAAALQAAPEAALVYSDHDHIDGGGRRHQPCFKPGFGRELFHARNLVSPLAVLRAEAVRSVGGLSVAWAHGVAGGHAMAYALAQRVMAARPDSHALRIPSMLSHASTAPRSDAMQARDDRVAAAAVRAALIDPATGRAPEVAPIGPGLRRVHWPLPAERPLASLIVPTRNALPLLQACIESIERLTTYRPYELLIVDNRSDDPEALAYLSGLEATARARVLRHDAPFNYSAINNRAAREAHGSVLVFLNNDVEVITPGWLDEMVAHAVRPGVGCVGAKLYFPDDTIQHAGVVLGIGGVAGHAHKYLPRDASGHGDLLRLVHNVSAVTGAAMAVQRSVFEEVGGFDEQALQVAYNDVDLCLRVMQSGRRNVWTPHAELYHHESKTRGADDTPEKLERWLAERAVMQARWPAWLADDPMYSPHLSRTHEDFSLRAVTPPPLR